MRGGIIALIVVVVVLIVVAAYVGMVALAGGLGSGKVVSEQRNVPTFTRVSLQGSGQLVIEQTGQTSLRVEADERSMGQVTSDVRGDTLYLGHETSWWTGIGLNRAPNFYVTVADLKEIALSGSGTAQSPKLDISDLSIIVSGSGDVKLNNVAAERLQPQISGSGTVQLDGRSGLQQVVVTGSGSYHARDLVSSQATVTVSGSGGVEVNVRDRLEVVVSGTGSVSYAGSPEITQQISGSGSVKQIGQ